MKNLILALIVGSSAIGFAASASETARKMKIDCQPMRNGPVGGLAANVSGVLTIKSIKKVSQNGAMAEQLKVKGKVDVFAGVGGRPILDLEDQSVEGEQNIVKGNINGNEWDANTIALGIRSEKTFMIAIMLHRPNESYVAYQGKFYKMSCTQENE